MIQWWVAGPFAFAITFAENWVASQERQAERNARTSRTRWWSVKSASWSSVFEVILLVDILLTVAEPLAIFPWVVAGGWLGQFLACEKTRKKFRRNAQNPPRRKKKKKQRVEESGDASGGDAGDAGGAGSKHSRGAGQSGEQPPAANLR